MDSFEKLLQNLLLKRQEAGLLRQLEQYHSLIDFCSNDYLGFARSHELHDAVLRKMVALSPPATGSTGSRLISGNSLLAEALETRIATFHKASSGLLFNSGYDLNLGFFSCVPQKGDTVLYDQWIHASIRDGLRLGVARHFSFRHNDLNHLKEKLRQASGQVFIAVESVYSMDGDFAPLTELTSLCKETGAMLIVDEAHGTGVFGPQGRGRVVELGLESQIFARIHTFGKAMGCHGAILLGPEILKNYLINHARSLIYSTSLPAHSLISIQCAYDFLEQHPEMLEALHERIRFFRSQLRSGSAISFLESYSPIQGALIPGNEKARQTALFLQKSGFAVKAILSPTVPAGTERLRICLHVHNQQEQIMRLLEALHHYQSISQGTS
ncbi:MAG: 8-amino-7-oxononanoate synthase [SAR324 cluster bacterium]|nr:8-amino-7-oxononanoate synthase [SAR324 cluster bacterium]